MEEREWRWKEVEERMARKKIEREKDKENFKSMFDDNSSHGIKSVPLFLKMKARY